MTADRPDLVGIARELVDTLHHAAMYNDKGCQWSNHSPAQIATIHASFQSQFERLATAIGQDAMGAELWDAIVSGAAARDDMGHFAHLAERILLP